MRGKKEAQEQLIRKFQKSGSANNIEAHYLDLVVSSINERVNNSSKPTKLTSLLNPQSKKISKSDEISKEIVMNFLKQHNLNYTLSTLYNESNNSIKIEHNKQWINKALQFSKKDSPMKQLVNNHKRIASTISKKTGNKYTAKLQSEEDFRSIGSLSSSTLNSVPIGYTKQEWEKKQIASMEHSQMAEPSSVNLSDFIPNGESTTMWEEGVNDAVNQLSTPKSFDQKKDKNINKTNPEKPKNKSKANDLLSETTSSISQIIPQGESLDGWEDGVQNAVNRLIEPIDFSSGNNRKNPSPIQNESVKSLLSESESKSSHKNLKNNNENNSELSEEDSLTSRFSEAQKQNEKKEKVLRFFREESDDIRAIHYSSASLSNNKLVDKEISLLSESDSSEGSVQPSKQNKGKKKVETPSESDKGLLLSSNQESLSQISIQGASSGHMKKAARRKVSKIKRTNDDVFDGLSSQVSSSIEIPSDHSKKNQRRKSSKIKHSNDDVFSEATASQSSNQLQLSEISLVGESTGHIQKEALKKVKSIEISDESPLSSKKSNSSASPEYNLSQIPLYDASTDHMRKESIKKIRDIETSEEYSPYSKRSASSSGREYSLSQIPLHDESTDHIRKESLKKVRDIELYVEASPSYSSSQKRKKTSKPKKKPEEIILSSPPSSQAQSISLTDIESDQLDDAQLSPPSSSTTNKSTPSQLSSSSNKIREVQREAADQMNSPSQPSSPRVNSSSPHESNSQQESNSPHQSASQHESVSQHESTSPHQSVSQHESASPHQPTSIQQSISQNESSPHKSESNHMSETSGSEAQYLRTKEAPQLDSELYRSKREQMLQNQKDMMVLELPENQSEITSESVEVDVEVEEEEEENDEETESTNEPSSFIATIPKKFVVEEESEFSYANSSESVNKSQYETEDEVEGQFGKGQNDIQLSVSITEESTSTDSQSRTENYTGIKNVIRYSTNSSEDYRESQSIIERNANTINEGQNRGQFSNEEQSNNNISDDYFVIIASTPSHSEESYSSHSHDANSFRQEIAFTNMTEIPYHSSLSTKDSYAYEEEEEEEENEEEEDEEEEPAPAPIILNKPLKKKRRRKMVKLTIKKETGPQTQTVTESKLKTAETQAKRIPVIKSVVLKSESSSYDIETEHSKFTRRTYEEHEYEEEEEEYEKRQKYSVDEEDSLFTQELEKVDISAWIKDKPSKNILSTFQKYQRQDDSDTFIGSTIDDELSPPRKHATKSRQAKRKSSSPTKQQSSTISPTSDKFTKREPEELNTIDNTIEDEEPTNKLNQPQSVIKNQPNQFDKNSQLNSTENNKIDQNEKQKSNQNQSLLSSHSNQPSRFSRGSQFNTITEEQTNNLNQTQQSTRCNRSSQSDTIDNEVKQQIQENSKSQIDQENSLINRKDENTEAKIVLEPEQLNQSQLESESTLSKKKKSKSKKKDKSEEESNEIHQSFLEKSELQQPLTLMETEIEAESEAHSEYSSESESEDEVEKKFKYKEPEERKLSLKLPSPEGEERSFIPTKYAHFNLSDPFNRNITKTPRTLAAPTSPDTLDSTIMPQDKIDSEEEQLFEEEEQNYSDLSQDFSEIYDYQYRKDMKNYERENQIPIQNQKKKRNNHIDSISMISIGESNTDVGSEKQNNQPSKLAGNNNNNNINEYNNNNNDDDNEYDDEFRSQNNRPIISKVGSVSSIVSNYAKSPRYNPQLKKQEIEKTPTTRSVSLETNRNQKNNSKPIIQTQQKNPASTNKKQNLKKYDESSSDATKPSFYEILGKQLSKNSESSIIDENSYNSSQPGINENNNDEIRPFEDDKSLFSEIYEDCSSKQKNKVSQRSVSGLNEENLSSVSSSMLSDNHEGRKSNKKKVRKSRKNSNSKLNDSSSSSSQKLIQEPSINTVPFSESNQEFPTKTKRTNSKSNSNSEEEPLIVNQNNNDQNASISENEKQKYDENLQITTKAVELTVDDDDDNNQQIDKLNTSEKARESSPTIFSSTYEKDQTRKFRLSSLQGGQLTSSSSAATPKVKAQNQNQQQQISSQSSNASGLIDTLDQTKGKQSDSNQPLKKRKKRIIRNSSSSSISNAESINNSQTASSNGGASINYSSSANSVFSDTYERCKGKSFSKKENKESSKLLSNSEENQEIILQRPEQSQQQQQQNQSERSESSSFSQLYNKSSSKINRSNLNDSKPSENSKVLRKKKVVKISSKQNSQNTQLDDYSSEKMPSEQFKFTPKMNPNEITNNNENNTSIEKSSRKVTPSNNSEVPSEFSRAYNADESSNNNSALTNRFIKNKKANVDNTSLISDILSNSPSKVPENQNEHQNPQKVKKVVKKVRKLSQIDHISSSSSDSSIKPDRSNSNKNDKIDKIDKIDFTGIHQASENENEEDIQFDIPSPPRKNSDKEREKENLNFSADMSLNSGSINDSMLDDINEKNDSKQVKKVKNNQSEIKNVKSDNLNAFKTTSVKAIDISDNQNSQSAVGGLIELNTDSEY